MKKENDSIEGWHEAINTIMEQSKDEQEKWRIALGEAANTIRIDDELLGFWKINPDQVLVARIGPKGAVKNGSLCYDRTMIEMLVKTLQAS